MRRPMRLVVTLIVHVSASEHVPMMSRKRRSEAPVARVHFAVQSLSFQATLHLLPSPRLNYIPQGHVAWRKCNETDMLTAQNRSSRILLAAPAVPLPPWSKLGRQAPGSADAPHQDETVRARQRHRQMEKRHPVQVPLACGEPRRRGFLLCARCEYGRYWRSAHVLNTVLGSDAQPVGR